ncbi:hypothetical protein D1AOALGA4SA_4334 [Olavius algarvensis Delta 1 endosymbiont]|nr:hypothetical protein D1AOALGA4SA_4334 [Olavius algarvensis Delta 1 endosymbiont]
MSATKSNKAWLGLNPTYEMQRDLRLKRFVLLKFHMRFRMSEKSSAYS